MQGKGLKNSLQDRDMWRGYSEEWHSGCYSHRQNNVSFPRDVHILTPGTYEYVTLAVLMD